jgi:hyperosmotically inducible protein
MKRRLSLALAALAAAAICSCTPSQQQQAKSTANDAFLTAQVKTRIAAIDPTTLSLVTVDVSNARATLTGQVPSLSEKVKIDQAVRGISGIVSVKDRLRVNPRAPTAKQIEADVSLQARVQTALAAQTGINALKIGVSAHDGVVVLTGTVPNGTVRTLAVQTAQGVSGVQRVIDRLKVQG